MKAYRWLEVSAGHLKGYSGREEGLGVFVYKATMTSWKPFQVYTHKDACFARKFCVMNLIMRMDSLTCSQLHWSDFFLEMMMDDDDDESTEVSSIVANLLLVWICTLESRINYVCIVHIGI